MIKTGIKLEGAMSLITGAGFGIGRETAKVFEREGSSLVIPDRNGKTVEPLAAEVEAAGGRAIPCWLASSEASDCTGASFVTDSAHTLADQLGADHCPERLFLVQ